MEEWIDVKGYEGLYQISNLGNVKSLPRKGTKGGLLKPSLRLGGYLGVALTKERKTKWFRIHRLVLENFKPCDNAAELHADHINRNRMDNRLENLQWLTPFEHLRKDSGKKAVICVETGKVYEAIKDAARELGISDSHISQACNGKRNTCGGYHWQYIGGDAE